MQQGMIGQPVQRGPFENQLQVERQQNLEKINKLRQTLEAAQQQEQQYKTQLERISHMKTTQLQEALQQAQHAEIQYKMMEVSAKMFVFIIWNASFDCSKEWQLKVTHKCLNQIILNSNA